MIPAPVHIDDATLLRIADGDEGAMRLLYDALFRSLLFYAESLIHERQPAEDIVMVAFTQYWERRRGFTALAAVKSFLYTAVRHACYRHNTQLLTREQHARETRRVSDMDDDFAESRMLIAEMTGRIYREIEQLNPRYREVVRLLFMQELSVKEAAAALNITEDNLRKRKERALEMLRNRVIQGKIGHLALLYLLLRQRMPWQD
ncbi:RNA polymerase sigma factor [Filimonas effusa]|uniref:Sigma-70 family RNA polymerase sigma factor n=1 Tax=Filimonas effusa TaxID=2508721 RepID=A0A4Q1DBD9_9BACT|nr:sigma-70 family RNA polymerase sigma factor [Filimonas effusa]RXK86774.1 sigma-70 family RNA polymerase sigma factor [Filimonas effusa]